MSEAVMDDRGPYRVYYVNRYIRQFTDRDAALDFICRQPDLLGWEIRDRSDDDGSSAGWR